MDRFEFVSSLVRSLAWPATLVVVVFLLRSQIGAALDGPVKRWKVGPSGAEVEYWEHVAEEALEQLPPGAAEKAEETRGGGLLSEWAPLVERSPDVAVMAAFGRIEAELRRIASADPLIARFGFEQMGARRLAGMLRDEGRITNEVASAIEGLSTLRNLAAHGQAGPLNAQRALEFIHIADAVLYALGHEQD